MTFGFVLCHRCFSSNGFHWRIRHSKKLLKRSLPEIKDLFQSFSNDKSVHQRSDRSVFQQVVYRVDHFDTAVHRPEVMLVMPKSIRSETLIVHEIVRGVDVGDLGNPSDRYSEQGRQPLADHHPLKHTIRDLSMNHEVQPGRCNGREIKRRGEELPSLLRRHWQRLDAVKAIKHHRVSPFCPHFPPSHRYAVDQIEEYTGYRRLYCITHELRLSYSLVCQVLK